MLLTALLPVCGEGGSDVIILTDSLLWTSQNFLPAFTKVAERYERVVMMFVAFGCTEREHFTASFNIVVMRQSFQLASEVSSFGFL